MPRRRRPASTSRSTANRRTAARSANARLTRQRENDERDRLRRLDGGVHRLLGDAAEAAVEVGPEPDRHEAGNDPRQETRSFGEPDRPDEREDRGAGDLAD